MDSAPDAPPHPLTDHFAWLERLALQLAGDADQADDLVQETWLATLKVRRGDLVSPRGFLHSVLQRALYRRRRSDRRRRDHESMLAAPGPAPATDEILERAEFGQELTRQVLALEEPYRTAILLRYANDLPPAAIASRLSLPLATVKSHLARGRELLRAEWKRLHPEGDRVWLSSLALLCPRSFPTPAPALPSALPSALLGATLVHAKSIAIALLVTCCAALFWYMSDPVQGPERRGAAAVARETAELEDLDVRADLIATEGTLATQRATVPAAPLGPETPSAAGTQQPAEQVFHGRVVDTTPRPVAGIDVVFRAQGVERARTVTDGAGRFELTAPAGTGELQVADPGVVNLFVFRAPAVADSDVWLVVAPHRRVAGTVVDEDRRPIANARVELALPEDFRARFDAVFDSAREQRANGSTGEFGRFDMERVPIIAGSMVRATLDGFELTEVEAPPYSVGDMELVLRRRENGQQTLLGRVVDQYGEPVGGALVSLGQLSAASAPDGTFQLDRADALEATKLVAIARGFLPGTFEAQPDTESGAPIFPDWIELRLGREALELAGRVVDEHGLPYPDLELWIDDPTEFGTVGDDLLAQVEFLTAPVESTYDPSSDAYFRTVRSDDDGRFRIQGLLERDYSLKLLDRSLLYTAGAGPYAAGRMDVVIVLPRPEVRTLEGRIVTGEGEPVANARIDIRVHAFGGVSRGSGHVITEGDGRFSFAGVASEEVGLWIRGKNIVPDHRWVQPADGDVEISVDILCHFKVDLNASTPAVDQISARGAEGQHCDIHDIGAGGYTIRSRFPLTDGRSGTLSVSRSATTLVLYSNGVESGTLDLRLDPGQLVVVTR